MRSYLILSSNYLYTTLEQNLNETIGKNLYKFEKIEI